MLFVEKIKLEKLQRYIYKRSKGQSTKDVITHIIEINEKEVLNKEEWNALLIPTCSYADLELFEWLLNNGAELNDNAISLVKMLVGSQEKRISFLMKRIDILDFILKRVDNKFLNDTLGYALLNACWYNNIYIVQYLIEEGADINFIASNGKTPYECAKIYAERFGDYTLYEYLSEYKKTVVS